MSVDKDRIASLVKRINETSNADFVKRLLDTKRSGSGNAYAGGGRYLLTSSEDPSSGISIIPRYGSAPDIRAPFIVPLDLPQEEISNPSVPLEIPGIPLQEPALDMSNVVPSLDYAGMKMRQRYAESGFRDRLTSKAGAKGRYQIMPITLQEYTERTGKTGDLMDPVFNEGIRDWYMDTRLGQFEALRRGSPTDLVREYRRYAAYNMGPGALNKALTKAEKEGVDIDNTTDWVKYLPKETRDYVNFIVGGEDIADTSRTQARYDLARRLYGIKAGGGPVKTIGNNANPVSLLPVGLGYLAEKLSGKLPKSYIVDYANRGYVYGYPGPGSLGLYALSPYITDQSQERHDYRDETRRALFSMYMGLSKEDGLSFDPADHIVESPYKPSNSSDPKAKYYTFKSRQEYLPEMFLDFQNHTGQFKISKGQDSGGNYVSLYDNWDLSPFGLLKSGKWETNANTIGGSPVELYDRVYESEDPELYKNIIEFGDRGVWYGSGGSIHIAPSKRGTFTAAAKQHGKSVQAFASQVLANKENYSPAMVKKANFARNAAKWHADGGLLHVYEGEEEPTQQLFKYGSDYAVPLLYQGPIQTVEPVVEPEPDRSINIDQTLLPARSTTAVTLMAPPPVKQAAVPAVDLPGGVVTMPSVFSDKDLIERNEKWEQSQYRPLESYSRGELAAHQRELAEQGGFSSQLVGLGKDEIKAIQEKLVHKGFLSDERDKDGHYKEVDGIVGRKTREAFDYYNIDGILGNRTRLAEDYVRSKNRSTASFNTDVPTKGVDGCAEWVSKKYAASGVKNEDVGVWGPAWRMPKNIVKSGGTMLFNIYDSGFEDVSGVDDLKKRTNRKIKETDIDYSILKPGDVVGIYLPGSLHHSDVLDNGTTYNTHVGIVTGFYDDGTPKVEHNIGGRHVVDRVDKIGLGGKVVVAARPAASYITNHDFEPEESKYEVDTSHYKHYSTPEKQKNLQEFMDSMAGAADYFSDIFPNADLDAVQKIALAVQRAETGYLQDTESTRTGWRGKKVKLEKILRELFTDYDPSSKSSDTSKFKLTSLSMAERNLLGIHDMDDLNEPGKAGLAAAYTLAKNYDYFKRYADMNPDLGLTKQDIEDLTALSYNQGMSRLRAIGSVNVNGERRILKSKLDDFRGTASNEQQINDFTSTKLGRIAKESPALAPVAKMLFDMGLGTRSSSYTNRARQAIANEIKKRQETAES